MESALALIPHTEAFQPAQSVCMATPIGQTTEAFIVPPILGRGFTAVLNMLRETLLEEIGRLATIRFK